MKTCNCNLCFRTPPYTQRAEACKNVIKLLQHQHSILNVEALAKSSLFTVLSQVGVGGGRGVPLTHPSSSLILEAISWKPKAFHRGPSQPGICTWTCAAHQPWAPGDDNIIHTSSSFISMNWSDSFLNQHCYNFKVQNEVSQKDKNHYNILTHICGI